MKTITTTGWVKSAQTSPYSTPDSFGPRKTHPDTQLWGQLAESLKQSQQILGQIEQINGQHAPQMRMQSLQTVRNILASLEEEAQGIHDYPPYQSNAA